MHFNFECQSLNIHLITPGYNLQYTNKNLSFVCSFEIRLIKPFKVMMKY